MRLFLLFFILLISVIEVSAAGIGAAPADLTFNVEKGKKQQKEVTVYNLEDREVQFDVYSDANFLEFFHNGIIEGSGMEKIIVEANSKQLDEGNYNSVIYITTSNGVSGVKLNLGTAVKVNVNVFAADKENIFVGIMTSITIVVVGLLIYLTAAMNKIFAAIKKAVY